MISPARNVVENTRRRGAILASVHSETPPARPGKGRPTAATLLAQVGRDLRARARRKLLREDVRQPWMRCRELDVLDELLASLAPRRCLEWGAGYSTLYFPERLDAGATWLAVEHDRDWSRRIAALVVRHGTTVAHVPADRQPWSDPEGEGTLADLAAYVAYPAGRGPFDFILVDGRARPACWERAPSLLAPGGVIVLHDANRERYRPLLESPLTRLVLRDRRRTAGGLAIATPRPSLAGLVDAERQRRLWSAYRALGRVIHL